ncbi:MAG: sugar ABC transporter substrate-binding protein [Lachnospiraceae bacterium]|nr:sugar ABC transporter substrate-binding protein [Lachnospiraceae bacterium]
MSIRKSMLIAVLSMLMAVVITVALVQVGLAISTDVVGTEEEAEVQKAKQTLYLWYTDEALTDYLTATSVRYLEETQVRIVPVLKSGKEYLDEINTASMQDEEMPDLFLITNDSLEQAYLAGLASALPINNVVNSTHFADTAIHAVTYQGHLVAYPFYYDTSALLYNKTYLTDYAAAQLQSEADVAAGEEAQAQAEAGVQEEAQAETGTQESESFSQEQILARMQESLPSTFEALATFADTYETPDGVEDIFRWDVTNILYNYAFLGAYMNVGGECGDDVTQIDIYNTDAVNALTMFQQMNQFYSIDADLVSYEGILEDFIGGKFVFTIAGTDAVATLEKAKADGVFDGEYGVIKLPNLTETLLSRPLSITTAVAVNGYSAQKSAANAFASYLVTTGAENLYTYTGRAAADTTCAVPYEALEEFMAAYESSVSMPKMMATSNLWLRLEVGFREIWGGADVDETLRKIAEKVTATISE